ncbi:hypothetical protein FG93_02584 [Bosea sp. LC85]|nr:hypothetical protein FG93_02584 [Bosea sp. LC85]
MDYSITIGLGFSLIMSALHSCASWHAGEWTLRACRCEAARRFAP